MIRKRKALGDHGILKIAEDAFLEGRIGAGEEILDQLSANERSIARCVRSDKAVKRAGMKVKEDVYRLYRSIGPDGAAHPKYAMVKKMQTQKHVFLGVYPAKCISPGLAEKTTCLQTTLQPLNNLLEFDSKEQALKSLGYQIVIPCPRKLRKSRKAK